MRSGLRHEKHDFVPQKQKDALHKMPAATRWLINLIFFHIVSLLILGFLSVFDSKSF